MQQAEVVKAYTCNQNRWYGIGLSDEEVHLQGQSPATLDPPVVAISIVADGDIKVHELIGVVRLDLANIPLDA